MNDPAPRRDVSYATVVRLPVYLQALCELAREGRGRVSSEELAALADVSPAMLRKDLSQLGSYGVRGVGYDVALLRLELDRVLGTAGSRPVLVIGMGHLGRALAHHTGFTTRGFELVALLDDDPAVIGEEHGALVVEHPDAAPAVVARHPDVIGVVATPVDTAQAAADRLVAAGVRGILDVAPTRLRVPADVEVRYVDLAAELQLLGLRTSPPAEPARRSAVVRGPAPCATARPEEITA